MKWPVSLKSVINPRDLEKILGDLVPPVRFGVGGMTETLEPQGRSGPWKRDYLGPALGLILYSSRMPKKPWTLLTTCFLLSPYSNSPLFPVVEFPGMFNASSPQG